MWIDGESERRRRAQALERRSAGAASRERVESTSVPAMGFWDRWASPQDRFAREALRIARRMPGVVDAQYDRAEFAIAVMRPGKDSPAWLFLSNVTPSVPRPPGSNDGTGSNAWCAS